jgi:hypothetical protein
MMKYNEWKLLQESIAPGFSLGLKNQQSLGFVGSNLQEFDNPHDHDEDDEDDDEDGDDDLEDDMLDGDILGAGSDEGGPEKSFPPDDSGDDGPPAQDGDDDGMAAVLGGIDPDLAGLGGDEMGAGPGPEMGHQELGDLATGGDLGALAGGDMGDPMAAMGGPEMGGPDMGGDLGGDMGAPEMGGDMDMGMPCPDCNPDGQGEPDPECHTCQGVGFLPDEMGGDDMGLGGDELGQQDVDPGIEKMNYMDMMRSYQKKYMSAAPAASPTAPMGGSVGNVGMAKPAISQQAKFMSKCAPKMMSANNKMPHPMHNKMNPVKHCGTGCYEANNMGTYQETDADFMASLSSHATGTARRKWSSGIQEDSLLQAVDAAYAPAEPKAGDVGFAPQSKIGAVGAGGYTQQDVEDIPVMERKYPTLKEWAAKKARRTKK